MKLAVLSATFYLLVFLGSSCRVQAFCCQTQSVGARPSYVHKVAAFGKDRRRTIEEYAQANGLPVSAVRKRFAATGTITCPYHGPCSNHPDQTCDGPVEGSAQLTLKADIITTAAHLLADQDTCKLVRSASSCTFSIQGPLQNHSIKVEALLDAGDSFRGPHCPIRETYRGDWAVMKLTRPVRDVTPYGIELEGKQLRKADSVLLVCHAIDFVRKAEKGASTTPRYIERCDVSDPHYSHSGDTIETDCDISFACSGGGLLTGEGDSLTLRAITSAGSLSMEEEEQAIDQGRVNTLTYDQGYASSQFVPVTREFLNALRKVNGLPPLKFPSTIWDEPTPPGQISLPRNLPPLQNYQQK